MIIRKLSAVLLVSMLFFGTTLAQAADYKTKLTLTVANAGSVYDEAYVLTVPGDLSLTGSGWNSVGNINVQHDSTKTTTFDTSKKVVVTVASENNGLTNTANDTQKIAYTIKSAESDTAAVTKFEFTAEEINTENGTDKTIGVDVENYSNKPAGDYEDNIVYHVEMMSLKTVTWNASDITQENYSDNQFSKDGITIYSNIDFNNNSFGQGTTFTTPLGHFTKIEIETNGDNLSGLGNGWTVSGNTATWTGSANTVIFNGMNIGVAKIVFTIELHKRIRERTRGRTR